MLSLLKWAIKHNYVQIYATIHKENSDVIPFYEKLGFIFDKEATDQAPERDLIIRLDL
jgi:RimJ/RimL family protein N-acetyltransferase